MYYYCYCNDNNNNYCISPRKSQVKVRGTYISDKISFFFFSFFQQEGKYTIASQQYNRVVQLLDGYFTKEEKEIRDPLLLVGHLNLAACHLRLNNNFKCMKECEKVGCPENTQLDEVQTRQAGFLGALTFHLCLLISMLD